MSVKQLIALLSQISDQDQQVNVGVEYGEWDCMTGDDCRLSENGDGVFIIAQQTFID